MEFLGVGVLELVLVLVIALMVAGPKRMLAWSYQLGKWIAALRTMWAQTAAALQREFDSAGVDIQVPHDIPTRADLRREMTRMVDKYGAPIQEPMRELQRDLQGTARELKSGLTVPVKPEQPDGEKPSWARLGPTPATLKPITPAANGPPAPNRMAEMGRSTPPPAPPPATSSVGRDLGAWSSTGSADNADEPPASDFGSWSAHGRGKS